MPYDFVLCGAVFLMVPLLTQSEETHKKGHCKADREKSQAFKNCTNKIKFILKGGYKVWHKV